MKESIKRATNGASKEEIISVLNTVEELIAVRHKTNEKIDEIFELIKKKYGDEPDTIRKFYGIKVLMKWTEGSEVEKLVNSLKEELNEED